MSGFGIYWLTPLYIRCLLAVSKRHALLKTLGALGAWIAFSAVLVVPYFVILRSLVQHLGAPPPWSALIPASGAWVGALIPGMRRLLRHRHELKAAGYG